MALIDGPPPVVLYSTNTWLAFNIAEKFFGGEHYVWCTPYFDAEAADPRRYTVAPTSSPKDIYLNLYKEATRGDRHSSKIEDVRVGLLKGAALKREAHIITEEQEKDIASIVSSAERNDFRPLLYIIPFAEVATKIKKVPITERAHPLSNEYIIESLPNSLFDAIEFQLA